MNYLLAQGIGTQVHYIPVHTQPWYQQHYGYKTGDFPIAEHYYEQCLSIPLFAKMTDAEQQHVIHVIRELVCA